MISLAVYLVPHRFYFLFLFPLIFLIPQESFADHTNATYTVNNQTVPCFATTNSSMCGFIDNPWNAIKHVFFVDYLGDWFVAIMFFPIIIVMYLLTKNGTYAGLIGLFIVAGTNQAQTLAVEVGITLVAISTGFLFYEVIRKRVDD